MSVTPLHLIILTFSYLALPHFLFEKDHLLTSNLSRGPWNRFIFDHPFFRIAIWFSPCGYKFLESREIRVFSTCVPMPSPVRHANVLFYHGSRILLTARNLQEFASQRFTGHLDGRNCCPCGPPVKINIQIILN